MFARYGSKLDVVHVQEFPEVPFAWSLYLLSRCNVRTASSVLSWWRDATQRSYALYALPAHVSPAWLVNGRLGQGTRLLCGTLSASPPSHSPARTADTLTHTVAHTPTCKTVWVFSLCRSSRARQMQRFFEAALDGYTYLEEP